MTLEVLLEQLEKPLVTPWVQTEYTGAFTELSGNPGGILGTSWLPKGFLKCVMEYFHRSVDCFWDAQDDQQMHT